MEVPILHACDTTEGWERGDTALGESELAIEVAGKREDGSLIKHLLIGDGKPSGPNAKRLRVTAEFFAGLPEALLALKAAIDAEAEARARGDSGLAEAISEEEEARVRRDRELTEAYRAMELELVRLNSEVEAYVASIAYFVQFIESKLGPLGGSFPVITEDGSYIVTEAGDYWVTA